MEDVIHSFASRFGLTDEEECEVVVHDDSRVCVSDFFMVGKLLAHKNYNKEAFMSFFKNLWRLKAYVSICSLCGDIFLFAFQFESDCSSVLNGGPWSFKQMLLVLAIVKECDVLEHGDCLGKFLHIKVDIDMF
ncbi:hypothetical protein COP2_006999 [Malus domestica]